MTSHDLVSEDPDSGMLGRQVGYIEKRDGIGQTPCSYEHYLVW